MDSLSWHDIKEALLEALPIIAAIFGVLLNGFVGTRLKKMRQRPSAAEAAERKGGDLPSRLKSSPGISYYALTTTAAAVVAIPIVCARENLHLWMITFVFGYWGGATIDHICGQ